MIEYVLSTEVLICLYGIRMEYKYTNKYMLLYFLYYRPLHACRHIILLVCYSIEHVCYSKLCQLSVRIAATLHCGYCHRCGYCCHFILYAMHCGYCHKCGYCHCFILYAMNCSDAPIIGQISDIRLISIIKNLIISIG